MLVPRLFSYSHLTDRGQLAEITVFNRGFKTEEHVELSLGPALCYNIVGSNSNDVLLVKNKLVIPRIGPGDEVTALLLVEGGSFSKSEISNCLSKESKGKVVSKLEEVSPTGPQRIALVAAFIALPLILYLMPIAFDYFAKTRPESRIQKVVLQGWTIPKHYESTSGLFSDLKEGKIQVSVGPVSRKKDITTVGISVHNTTLHVLKYSVSMTTNKSDERIPLYERHISDILVTPGGSSQKSINVVIPVRSLNMPDKVIFIEMFLESGLGDSLKLTKIYAIE